MRQATSMLVTPKDQIQLGDGWGGEHDCIQIVSDGETVGLTLRFLEDASLDALIDTLSALQQDRAIRRAALQVIDYAASEGRDQ